MNFRGLIEGVSASSIWMRLICRFPAPRSTSDGRKRITSSSRNIITTYLKSVAWFLDEKNRDEVLAVRK
jgi:hypothetical protein